jgi:hypothetical protein
MHKMNKIIVDRSRRGPQSVPVLHALGWRRSRLRGILFGQQVLAKIL